MDALRRRRVWASIATFVVVYGIVVVLSTPGDLVVPALGVVLAAAIAFGTFVALGPPRPGPG
jgi:hypothetical protein